MHNPAHFWLGLQERGFEPLRDGQGRFQGARKAEGERIIELGNFRYFENLTPYGLVKVESVLGMVDQTLAAMNELATDGPFQLEINPRVTRRPTT